MVGFHYLFIYFTQKHCSHTESDLHHQAGWGSFLGIDGEDVSEEGLGWQNIWPQGVRHPKYGTSCLRLWSQSRDIGRCKEFWILIDFEFIFEVQLLVFERRAAGYPPENRIPMDPRLQSIPEARRRNLMQILTEGVRVLQIKRTKSVVRFGLLCWLSHNVSVYVLGDAT